MQRPASDIGGKDQAAQQLGAWLHVESGQTAEDTGPTDSHAADASVEGSKAAAAQYQTSRESQEQSLHDLKDDLHRFEQGVEAIVSAQLSRFERSLASICDAALAKLSRDLSSMVRSPELHKSPTINGDNKMAGIEPDD